MMQFGVSRSSRNEAALPQVTRGHFRSRDEDRGHTFRSAISDNPMLHANLMAVCFIEVEIWQIEVLHCGNTHFRPFLLLDQMIFIYELDTYVTDMGPAQGRGPRGRSIG